MRFRFRNLLSVVVLYAVVVWLLYTGSESATLIIAFFVYAGVCIFLSSGMIKQAEARDSGKVIEFSQSGALNALGSEWGSFHHVFFHSESVFDKLLSSFTHAFSEKFQSQPLKKLIFTDVDPELQEHEGRTFLYTSTPKTIRGTSFVFLATFAETSNVQTVRWWILIKGLRDPNKLVWRYALAPISFPFVARPYLKREYDPLPGITTIYPGFFSNIDVIRKTREIQFLAFQTLIDVLESYGIDTSDLKLQKANLLNINVTGGQVTFGSVVQGAQNLVSSAVAGASK